MRVFSFLALILLSCNSVSSPVPADDTILGLSEEFLTRLKAGESTDAVAKKYADLDLDVLAETVDTENEKLAFWVNTYNAFVQRLLTNDPSLFDDRGKFFSAKQIDIAGILMSLDEIEHGIIRGNRWKLSLGYLPKPFAPKHVRMLKTDGQDGRVHLALNCGAKSCPPIAIYHWASVSDELDYMAKRYLEETTKIEGEVVTVTPLMSWFRGDFGGKKGIKKDYLERYGIVDDTSDIDLDFGDYDWTLSTGNYVDLPTE